MISVNKFLVLCHGHSAIFSISYSLRYSHWTFHGNVAIPVATMSGAFWTAAQCAGKPVRFRMGKFPYGDISERLHALQATAIRVKEV